MSVEVPDATALSGAIAGEVVAQGDPGWDGAREAWNLTADQRPPLVVMAHSAADVEATVRFAAASGLRVAPQSTGHGATSMGALEGTILLRTSRMTEVEVDPAERTATVQAGALWSDVVEPAGREGLVCLHGMSAAVGVAGYTLGGGIGWLARREGFAASHVRAFEVVGADGEARRIDEASDPDLFWALRGGGGRPAIVTSFEFELFELREAFAGALMWPIERADQVVHAFRDWATTAPDEVTSTMKLIRYPALPTVPDKLRGRALVTVTLVYCGEEVSGDELVRPLRELGNLHLDTLSMVAGDTLGELAGDPTHPMPSLGHATLLERFTPEAADDYLALAGPRANTPLTFLEIRHLGGALRSAEPDPGAAGPLDADALVFGAASVKSPGAADAIRAGLTEVGERLAPHAGARDTILTFDEHRPMSDAFAPHVAERLERIAAAHDPDGLLVANHVAD